MNLSGKYPFSLVFLRRTGRFQYIKVSRGSTSSSAFLYCVPQKAQELTFRI